jgi:hypothetical protein
MKGGTCRANNECKSLTALGQDAKRPVITAFPAAKSGNLARCGSAATGFVVNMARNMVILF